MVKKSDFSDFEDNPLLGVEIEFQDTNTQKELLKQYAEIISHSGTVHELKQNISIVLEKLKTLGLYKSCEVLVLPGQVTDSALVNFTLKELPWWDYSCLLQPNIEGGRIKLTGILRNIFEKADLTNFGLGLAHKTRNLEYEFLHINKMFYPGT